MRAAVAQSLFLAARYGTAQPEANALCAIALEKAGCSHAALEYWDTLARNWPYQIDWLRQALRSAWRISESSEQGKAFAERWQGMLERVFITSPSLGLLSEMSRHGWQGKGAAGVHQGRLRAWFWLKTDEKLRIQISAGGPSLSLSIRRTASDGTYSLYAVNDALPDTPSPYIISITDTEGKHISGSPLTCSPAQSAAPSIKKRNLVQRRTSSSITVIIPVYDDRKATLACLGSVFASLKHNKTRTQLLVVWDHGPDITLYEALQRLAQRRKITLQATPVNMGFLGSVNHALSLVPEGDVILLNADTLVHGDWIDRMAQAACRPDAATVTALGSEAEHVSFPAYYDRGTVRRLRDVGMLDTACKKLSSNDALQEIPVGVGFCMAVTRRALQRFGGFDGLHIFNGYGEEVDYCLRAVEAGLKNYAALNVFVAHLGGRSFGISKKALVAQNNAAIFARFPHYKFEYDLFLLEDRLKAARETISYHACQCLPAIRVLHVHAWSDMYLPAFSGKDGSSRMPNDEQAALFVLPCASGARVMLRIHSQIPLADMHFTLPVDTARLRELTKVCGFKTVRLHCHFPRVEGIAGSLGLPVKTQSAYISGLLAPYALKNGVCLVSPPRSLKSWQQLCSFARQNQETLFYVYRLQKFWGNILRPANVRELPEADDLRPLLPGVLLLTDTASDMQPWQTWLHEHACDLPLCSFGEAA